MKTNLLYLHDAYQKTASAKIVEIVKDGNEQALILDQTIFYAQGGGQPADHGTIQNKNGSFLVSHVSYNGGQPLHKGKSTGTLNEGDTVELMIDWDRRYYHMQLHTAGHVLDQAVKNVLAENKGIDGDHGIGKRSFVAFESEVLEEHVQDIQDQIEAVIEQNLPITNAMTSYQELQKNGIELPYDLPKNKELRLTQIGEYPPMPDGGTHLKSTGELWPVSVTSVSEKKGAWRVNYECKNPNATEKKEMKSSPKHTSHKQTSTEPQHDLSQTVSQYLKELQTDAQTLDTQELKTKYLGKKGVFNSVARQLKTITSPEEKKSAGQLLNEFKTKLEETIAQHHARQSGPAWVDVTIPGKQPKVGHMHPVSQAMEEITHIFEQIGFTRVRYQEVDWDWYVFESLNMPPDHPARDEWETFFIDVPDTTQHIAYDPEKPRLRHPEKVGGKMVLTTHTSNGQVREMERLGKPPIRMINIGRCYRRQQDATHTQMFHQFEGLVVDKGITIQHLKGTLDHFAKEFYGPDVKSRIRPFHFRFTEPSFEVDFSCHICHGTGKIKTKGSTEKCKFCKSGWHEVGGAGMVHPNVLKAGGIDPDEYTGFAFGWGIERTYTLKPGLSIDDIRLIYSGDLRFLEQF